MLDWAVDQNEHPVVIRIPSVVTHSASAVEKDYGALNRYQIAQKGSQVALIAAGSFFGLGQQVADRLKEKGINATLINPRYLSGIDENVLDELRSNHSLVATLEDGIVNGGFGEKIASFYGTSAMKVLNFGAKKEFTDRTPLDEIYQRNHLTVEQIVADITKNI